MLNSHSFVGSVLYEMEIKYDQFRCPAGSWSSSSDNEIERMIIIIVMTVQMRNIEFSDLIY